MLLATVVLWSLNIVGARYAYLHGVLPLTYGAVRFALGAAVFVVLVLVLERSLRLQRGDVWLALAAGVMLFLNQWSFMTAIGEASASVIALVLGLNPLVVAVAGMLLGTEHLPSRFWIGALTSLAGVALVGLATGGAVEGSAAGIFFAAMTSVSWGGYSLAIVPLMQRYSPLRISAVVTPLMLVLFLVVAAPQVAVQDWTVPSWLWLVPICSALVALVIANVLWFHALDRVGPGRAMLATNLQPFIAALLAIALLGEPLAPLLMAGGVLIAVGIGLAARRQPVAAPVEV